MPTFSFKPVVKDKVKKNSSNSNKYNKYEVLEKALKGVVFINMDYSYIIKVDKDQYAIAPENYSCKGVSDVYEQILTDDLRRCRHIRHIDRRFECNPNYFLPFTAGCCVIGNLVKHRASGKVFFNIKKVYIDHNNEVAKLAVKFYRDNYEDISNYRNSIIEELNEQIRSC